ncbi:MAG: arginine:agmatine antiporter, partial [Clostridiaceae bacterium]
ILGTAYGIWLLYAGGVMYLLISAILYAPGILVYIKGKKEKQERYFDNTRDRIAVGVILLIALISLVLILNGSINPF